MVARQRVKEGIVSENIETKTVVLCSSADLVERGEAVPFDIQYAGRKARGFAVRFNGQVHAYLNQCGHVPMEMDYQPNRFFDLTGQYLVCATHGAYYCPQTGQCRGGPGRRPLVKIAIAEADGVVRWHTDSCLKPPAAQHD